MTRLQSTVSKLSQRLPSSCCTCFTVLTLWASSFSSWSMGSSPGVTKQPEECVKVTVGCEAVSMTFKNVKSAQPPTTLCLPSVLLRESEPESLLKKSQKKRDDLSCSHICRITQNKDSLTVCLLRLLFLHVIWFHLWWPGWKLKWTIMEEDAAGCSWDQVRGGKC